MYYLLKYRLVEKMLKIIPPDYRFLFKYLILFLKQIIHLTINFIYKYLYIYLLIIFNFSNNYYIIVLKSIFYKSII